MITLANGSQTMAKGIGSACPFPSIPLTFVLYVPDSPFNLISITKLTRDLKCLIIVENHRIFLEYPLIYSLSFLYNICPSFFVLNLLPFFMSSWCI